MITVNRLGNLVRELQAIPEITQGLPEACLFMQPDNPLVHVDLLIKDEVNGVLLTWRDDDYYGAGWHVPGGVIRLRKPFSDRIHAVARKSWRQRSA